MKKNLTSIILSSGVLLLAVALTVYGALRPLPETTLTRPLAEIVPSKIAGWTVKDQPIAETEEMKKAVGELLNYDDAIFRSYTQGKTTVSVYVAYWKPGKMSPRLIAGHTPDVCWVGNGWKCTARDFAYSIPSLNNKINDIPPAQAGTYTLAGQAQHVLFWHLHDGKSVAYDIAGAPPWWATISELWKNGLNQRGEQFFIRISSNVPIEESLKTTALSEALIALGPLGLYTVKPSIAL